jgi:hypothetical protein
VAGILWRLWFSCSKSCSNFRFKLFLVGRSMERNGWWFRGEKKGVFARFLWFFVETKKGMGKWGWIK